MLSPSPLSLFCTILLCFPLALYLTVTTTPTLSSTITTESARPAAVSDAQSRRVTRLFIPDAATTTTNKHTLRQHKLFTRSTPFSSSSSSSPPPPLTPSPLSPDSAAEAAPQEASPADRWYDIVVDYEDDKLLLRDAARVNRNAATPKKVAFMFLTTTPLPTAPIWELFFAGAGSPGAYYNVYVHADPSFTYDPPFQGVFAGRVIPSKPTRRFTPTLASATRRLLAHALLHDEGNAVFVLLSASCIPLHSFNFTYAALVGSGTSFVEMLRDHNQSYGRWASRGEHAMLPEVRIEDFRIGSQFFALTRRHALLVVRDRRLWRKFRMPCVFRWTCFPEENYFPTLLSMADPRGCVHTTLTHVDWQRRSAVMHPRARWPRWDPN